MYDEQGARRDRRAILKNGLVLAGALAVPSAVSATQRLTARDLKPMTQPPLPRSPAMPISSSRVVRPELLRQAMAALS